MLRLPKNNRRLIAIKLAPALGAIAQSRSVKAPLAHKRLVELAIIGNRALRFQQLQNEKQLDISERSFWETVEKSLKDEAQYTVLQMNSKKKDKTLQE